MGGGQSPGISKEVKCSYEWTVTGLRNHTNIQWMTCSRKFSSQHAQGFGMLEWKIELSANGTAVTKVNFGTSTNWSSRPKYELFLCLLTDIEDVEFDVTNSYSIIEECNNTAGSSPSFQNTSGRARIISEGKKNHRFKMADRKMCFYSHPANLPSTADQWKIKCEISYISKDAIFGMDTYENKKSEHMELLENFGNLLENPKFADVTLCVKGKEFRVHKNILSARSSVFEAMFQHKMKENLKNRVEIEGLEPDTVKEMLKFIYTGSAPNLTKMADELLIAADRYELKSLMTMAEKHLVSNISLENAIKMLVFADMHSSSNLYNAATEFIASNVTELMEAEDWKRMMGNEPRLMEAILREVAKKNH